jgi:hypothetical protein
MWMQWLITCVIVVACLAYAIKTLAPKFSVGKAGCSGCDGCGTAAKLCATTKDGFQPLVFHKRGTKREAGEN